MILIILPECIHSVRVTELLFASLLSEDEYNDNETIILVTFHVMKMVLKWKMFVQLKRRLVI